MKPDASVLALLVNLKNIGCRLWLENGKLKVRTGKGGISDNLKAQLQQKKPEIIAFLTQEVHDNRPDWTVIQKQPAAVPLVLSYAQQRLWFLAKLEGPSATYNMPAALELKGSLDISALENTFAILVQRHQSLRLSFPDVNGEATVRELPVYNPLVVSNLSHLSADEQNAQVQRLAKKHAEDPFDLANGPLLRVHLLTLNGAEGLRANHVVLLFNMHHIISDGWSMEVLVREWIDIYSALSQDQIPDLEPLPIQYSDYAAWQRSWLQGEVLQRQLDYWTEQLGGAPGLLELPTDWPRPAVQSFRGAHLQTQLSPELTQQLKNLCQQQGTTLFMTLLAAFNVLLYRYTGQDDILIGSPIANRTHSQTEHLIGFFVNTLVLRTKIPTRIGFTKLLNYIRQTALGAYAHQDIPFEHLVEQLKPERTLSHSPLFQVMFALQNNTESDLSLPKLDIQALEQESTVAKFDLTFSAAEVEDYLEFGWEYATDLFRAERIQRMSEHFVILLQGIVQNPAADIHDLPLLTDAETWQLNRWNQTRTDYPQDKTIVDLFQAQVNKTPDNIAVVFKKQQLTYAELNRQANQLAHYLRTLTTIDNSLIAVCMERSADMIIGLLGILKTGGAYVPLDPDYPLERLTYMLNDSQASLLLSQSHLQERLPTSDVQIIYLDEPEVFDKQPDDNLILVSGMEDLAYVIYTSGSTGQPKGVMCTHYGLCNLIHWHQQQFNVKETDRATLIANVAFDASTWELWPYLSAGACVYPTHFSGSVQELIENLTTWDISMAFLPTPILQHALLEKVSWPASLRIVLTGGDKLANFPSKPLPFALFNNYGPTENTVVTTFTQVSEPVQTNVGSPPIGRPIANIQVYILDANHRLQPIGIPGELSISGAGLARGYLNRPELTAKKFIEIELFDAKQRIYKTGDLARWLPDGNLEYLGRLDHQVKLRGFRIELGEIEAVLTQHEAVKEAVVVLYEREGNKALAAYLTVISNQLSVITPEEQNTQLITDSCSLITDLRSWLKKRLPDYMVPAHFMVLDRLPLTPNGKIDRKALPDPNLAASGIDYEAPRNATEEQLANIWATVLKRPDIGVHDNFFDLGGDSILSIQIVARARQAGLGLSPKDVFAHQTLAELAHAVQPLSAIDAEQGMVQGDVPLTPIQAWFLAGDNIEPWHFNQAMLLEVPADTDETAWQQALAALLKHHDALRLRYHQKNGEWRQSYVAPDGTVPFHMEIINGPDLAAALEVRATYWQASLKLESGPLMRLVLFHHAQGNRLLWVIHHLAVDGVSWRILLEDLHTAYTQARAGETLQLPAKTSSFKAWSEHLHQWRNSPEFAIEAEYWQQLPCSTSGLPVDNPAGSNRVVDTCHYTLTLNETVTRALFEQTPAAYRTGINDLLLSALLLALHDWSGQYQYTIDLESHGRTNRFDDIDLSRTVGWFTALYSVVFELPEQPDLGIIIKSVKEQLRQIPHDGVGYGLLRQQGKDLVQGQIVFNYLGQFDQTAQSDGFCLAQESSGRGQSLTGTRDHLIDINGLTVHGQLSFTFSYSGEQYQTSTIQTLAEHYQHHLKNLIGHCQHHYGYTPSDFPLATLTQAQLDTLVQPYGNNIVAVYPLSPMQQGMLFHSRYAPDSGVYFKQFSIRLSGDVHPVTLRQAWQFLVDRHPTLRTVFRYEQDSPLQIVLKQVELSWREEDWQSLGEDKCQQQRETLLTQASQPDFDFSRAPLMRLYLIRETADSYRLLWCFHHIIMDGWCLPILFTELFTTYTALRHGQNPHLAPVNRYQNYIAWLMQQDQQVAQSYWQHKLAGFTAPTLIPIVKHGQQSDTCHATQFTLSAEQTRRLNQFARGQRLTLNTLIQAAWAILLGRYSGESDIVFGATVSGRNVPISGIEQMVGVFINTLPLRVDLNQDLKTLLHSLQNQHQQDNHYAYTNLADIQNWSAVPNGVALFDSILVFENYPVDDALKEQQNLPFQIDDFHTVEQTTNYLLTLRVAPDKNIGFTLNFDRNRIDPQAGELLFAHFQNLLQGIVNNLEADIHHLPLLTEAETHQLIQWNQAKATYPPDKTLVNLFEEQVEKTPSNTAVVFEKQQLTYAELNQQANRLAHYLRTLSAADSNLLKTDNCLIAICVERSLDMVIGLLAILKAGGAYVPLDPDYPPERLSYILEDSLAPVLLTQSRLKDRLPATDARIVYLDEAEAFTNQPGENPIQVSGAGDLAYVIYTSGSTGKPKGCLMTHHNVTRLFAATEAWYHFDASDVWTLFHSYAFDFSVWELWGAWCYGGKLVVVPYLTSRNPEAFLELLLHHQVTVLNQTPSAFRQLIDADQRHANQYALKWVIFGGEALEFSTLKPWFDKHGDQHPQLVNMYGITETTVHVTFYPLTRQRIQQSSSVIGKPIPDLRAYVLDTHDQPVPISVPGELCIAGNGLARGYLNRSELTAKKFSEIDLFGEKLRVYKTGDLARWLPDGNLEYLGRIDHQVKLRGFRIELGEIESVLMQHEVVKEAVVILYERENNQALAAYVTVISEQLSMNRDQSIGKEQQVSSFSQLKNNLRSWLKEQLPDYMIPSYFTVLDQLPLTANGKIDRQALGKLDNLIESNRAFVAPRTRLEELIAGIWREVLGVAQIGIHDNFFELGGHSLLGMRVINRLNEKTGEIFYIYTLFEAPTLEAFSDYIEQNYPALYARVNRIISASVTRHEYRPHGRITEDTLAKFQSLLPNKHFSTNGQAKNPPAIFILAPPRSGTTLLRVILEGHPSLFSPPEMELLGFNTLRERYAQCNALDPFWLQGSIRALMELEHCDTKPARALMQGYEEQDLTIQQFYKVLQERLGERLLVDKTPFYAIDSRILAQIEKHFDKAFYVHLIRHPYGMINSFEKVRLRQIMSGHPYVAGLSAVLEPDSDTELAELIWLQCHRNILDLLSKIPNTRQCRVYFEDLVAAPYQTIQQLCAALQLPFDESMLDIYQQQPRMTDGIYAEGKMLGDIKFHQHQQINSQVAEQWREHYQDDFLGEITWEIAQQLGYQRDILNWNVTQSNNTQPPIKSQPVGVPLVMSYAQQRLWFLAQLEGSSATYNIQAALELSGPLNISALETTFVTLVQRHQSLRLCFPEVNGEATVREIHAYNPLTISDLNHLSADEQNTKVQRLAQEHASKAFDLTNGPLLRLHLLILGDQHAVLLFSMHHIISDGWSIDVLIREWVNLYHAFSQGQAPDLEPLPIQYPDYAAWQRSWLQGDVLQRQIDYWTEQLSGAPGLLELPSDYPRPAVQSYRGTHLQSQISTELTQQLKQLSQQQGVTLFMTLLAAFNVLLHRYSSQDDILIGSPIANRTHSQTENLIGFFVNTLVLRTQIFACTSFIELLKHTRQTALGAYAHQDIPFEHLVEQLKPERSLSHSPLFQVMFVLQNHVQSDLNLPELDIQALKQENLAAKFDLTLSAIEIEDRLEFNWEYATDLFQAERIRRMAGHFAILLQGIVLNPKVDIHSLPLLSQTETRQLIQWNQTKTGYPQDKTIVHLFEEQVARTPDNMAVVFEDRQLTYAELNQQANRLAHYLHTLKDTVHGSRFTDNCLIALCVERSPEMVIGLLGILKAGWAYVPMDPDYPPERLNYMLDDSQAPLLLTQSRLKDLLPATETRIVYLDEAEAFDQQPTANLAVVSGPTDLAYVIYTSGSTGKPKGVQIIHAGLTNLVFAQIQAFQLTSASRQLQFASFSFDAAVSEIATALLSGATLCLVNKTRLTDTDFVTFLDQQRISHITLPPSFLNSLPQETLPHLKTLVVAGEACPVSLLSHWAKDRHFINAYGPTENTVCASMAVCFSDMSNISIGRPIANIQIHILDLNHQPQPVGIPGELCIAGVGLARGYLNRPELTTEKFIEVELFDEKQRIYKTGDLARWLPDGNLEYLGRLDHQVKLRGFRIELGEIEAVLMQHEAVQEAVTVLRERDGNRTLVAYITTHNGEFIIHHSSFITDLRARLKDILPNYMIPTHFMVLGKLPLTPNGKIDRKALPDPELAEGSVDYEPPRNTIEQQLAEIWSTVLKRSDISVHDNFFDLGGDSILSIQIVARARQAGLGLSPRDVFAHQTLAELAHAVKPLRVTDAEPGLVQGEVPLIPIQARFFAGDSTEFWHFNQTMLLEVPADTNETAWQQALAVLLEHHDALRLRYHQENGEWQQSYAILGEAVPFHVEILSSPNLATALDTSATYWQASLNLEHGPLTRLVLFRHEQGDRLLWVIHHLAVDGVSWRILLEDLHTTYTQACAGEALHLPAKTSSFKAWSEHLQQWRNRPEFAIETEYWQLLPRPTLGLPVDNPAGSNQVIDTGHHTLTLDETVTRRLLEEAPAAYRTGINDLLLSALLLALHDWSGQYQYTIDLESHGRANLFDDIDLSRTVGWFTVLYSVVLELPEPHDLGVILKSVKEQLRQVPHDGIGYGLLRQQGEDLAQGQILFNYLGQFHQTAQQEGFSLAQEGSGRNQSLTGTRDHLIDINGLTVNGRLSLTFSYSGKQYQSNTIQTLAQRYQHHLERLIGHCESHYGYTPSDFPLTTLNQIQLDTLVQPYGNNIAAIYPLSPMQQGMLFHSLYAPDSGVYFEQFNIRLRDVHSATLHQAWQWLVDRHPVLRTAFFYEHDLPLQIVLKQAKLPWIEEDWQHLSEEECQQQLETLLEQERHQGFEFNCAPLMRLHLIRETADSYRLLWHHHHILMDGWCLPIVFTELFTAYTTLRQGRSPALPPVNRYQNYIAWLVQQDQQAAQSYWQQKLAGFNAPTPIPIVMHGQQTTALDKVQLTLSVEQTQELEQFARCQRITLNTLVQSAWAILLGRYSGESDIVFGVTTSGRNVPISGIERMIGLFINTLPLRADLSQDLKTLLHALQNQQQQDNLYAYTNLADIQNWSEVPNGVALFDSIIVFENYPVDETLNDQQNLPFQIDEFQGIEQTNYLLTLSVSPGNTLGFTLNFDRNLIDPQASECLLEHYQNLLQGIIDNIETNINRLPLLTEVEIQQLIQWNQTETDYPKEKTIVDLFDAQAAKNPSNIAVVFEEQRLTYAELNQQANRLAYYLRTLIEIDNDLIAICVERSLDMVIGLLGILKAGGAYMPMDPDYPPERLSYMLEDSGVSLLLTQSWLKNRLPSPNVHTVYLDEPEAFAKQLSNNPVCGPRELAYVIYTSGSTGKPKGVMVTHRNLSNAYFAWHDVYQLESVSSHLQMANFAFDVFTADWVRALGSGGKLVLCPRNLLTEPDKLFALIEKEHIDCAEFVPAVMRGLLEYLQVSHRQLNQMKCCIVGSDLWHYAEYRQLTRCCGENTTVYNSYGVTECTVDSSYYESDPAHQITDVTLNVPIGHPFPNTQIYILDITHQPQPIGIPGELCIAGSGLAHGYLNRPKLTTEKFLEIDLFGKRQRIYKTGDLARWLPDGNLEYLGRLDHQVKLRGFRIELGEIESALTQHETVKEAVVVLREREGHQALAAYLTVHDIRHSSFIIDLRAWLRSTLPDYMVPTSFTVLDKLPLTPNGKIDRKALPDPDTAFNRDHYEPPRTATEQQLADIWSAVLKRPHIGIYDNFFDLGGDSILSIQIVARARQAKLSVSPRDVFQNQTIAELAQVAQTLQKITAEQGLVKGEVPLIPIQQQFFEQNFPAYWHYNQSILLRIPDNIDIKALRQAFNILLSHHDALRCRYHYVSDHWVQSFSAPSETVPFFVEDLTQSQNPAAELQRLTETYQSSFNLSDGPITHMVVFRLADSARLFWCIHHLAVDGVSWRILLEDLHTVYTQIAAAQSPRLPDKTSSFKLWAERLMAYAQTQALTDELTYWCALPITLSFPVDNPEGKNHLEYIQSCTITFSSQETESLLHEIPATYNTRINDVLLTALALAVTDWSGQTQCLIDLEGHGRVDLFPDIDLSRTVGWFTIVYPVLLSLPADLDLGASLRAIKEQLGLIPHEGIGYGLLSYLNKESLPKGDILFNYLGQFDQSMEVDLFTLADESVGGDVSPNGTHDHLIDINGIIVQGQLSLYWSYSSDCYRAETIKALAAAYHNRLTALIHHCQTASVKRPSLETLVSLNVRNDRPLGLFCLPGSGTKTGYLRTLANTLKLNLSIYGLESPGLDGQRRIPETVEALAQAHLEIIRAVQPHGPYYFLGHSFGVAVAFELAWHLEQAGEPVALMAVLDQPTPQPPSKDNPTKEETELEAMWGIVQTIKMLSGIEPPFDLAYLEKTNSFNYACRTVMNWLKQENAHEMLFSSQAAPEELGALVKVYQTNMRAFPRYQLQGKHLRCAIDLICTEESIEIFTKANRELSDGWGWKKHSIAGVRIHRMAGSHINMILHPQVQVIANILKGILVHTL
jgi:amino acid adenylation domain-containing protein/non-ribosomal peptide synthase protein (TIGR01720 family)